MFSWNPDIEGNTTLFAGSGTDSNAQGVPATTVWTDSISSVVFDYSTATAYIGMIFTQINKLQGVQVS
jgi:hypothetical protein